MEQQNRWTGSETQAPGSNGPTGAPGSSHAHDPITGKADLSKRFLAMLIDAVLAFVVGMIPFIGGIVAAAYWLVRDGLELEFMDGRSIGKKVMKLRPVRLDGGRMDIETSVKRNWMFALGGVISLLLFIPIIGWLLMIPVALFALAIGLFEVFRVLTEAEGRRLGDTMANTKVIETDL
jgi:uncharacterized RDD family membrane protein YckC